MCKANVSLSEKNGDMNSQGSNRNQRPVHVSSRPALGQKSATPPRRTRPKRPPSNFASRFSPILSGWALLPLRAFLGITFTFAALQKLANPNFFNHSSPIGIYASLVASGRISPIHALIGHLLPYATPIGIMIAVGELAVGIGTLLGIWTRIAALGGAMLSFTLFLTVSFHSSPYFTGADIVFFFAWIPLIVAGSGGLYSLDALIGQRVRHEAGLAADPPVAIAFVQVRSFCGHHVEGRCDAREDSKCEIRGCPVLDQPSQSPRQSADLQRRAFVVGGAAAGAVAIGAGVLAGAAAVLGRAIGGAKAVKSSTVTLAFGAGSHHSTSTTVVQGRSTTTSRAPGTTTTLTPSTTNPSTTTTTATKTTLPGTVIGKITQIPVGGAARFTDPATKNPALALQPTKGSLVAFTAICPHAGCQVGFSSTAKTIVCPCHGSQFNATTGAVLEGPATKGLTSIHIAVSSTGEIYVDG